MTLDEQFQQLINQRLANPLLDGPMVLVSLLGNLVPFLLLALLLARAGKRTQVFAFLLAMIVSEGAVTFLKDTIARSRPEDARLLLSVTSEYSMPSGHAARAFAAAVALWSLGPRWRLGTFGFAVLTMVSRVYVGVHWPADVLLGALIGAVSGFVAVTLVDAVAYEFELVDAQRAPGLRIVWLRFLDMLRWLRNADYLYSLRLLGRVTAEQAQRLSRLSTYWGLVRLFGPILLIAVAWIVYLATLPEWAGKTVTCLAGYFAPFGIEVGVPICIGLGIPWWAVVAIITYIDTWLTLFLILNLDVLYRVPRVGRWLHNAQEKGERFVRKRPWILRVQFIGIALFVFLPLPGTGAVSGILLGRMVGMGRFVVWGAVILGTVVRITLFGLAATGLFHLLP